MPRDIAEEFGLNYLIREGNTPSGFTLRDLFAAFALAGILHDGNPYQLGIRWCASTAYEMADAMLDQRAELAQRRTGGES